MKKNVSLQTKIIGIISIFVFSNLIVLVVGLSKLSSANHTTDEILHVFYKRIELLNKMELDEGKLAIKLRDGIFAENEQDRKQAWQDLEKLNLEIKDLIKQQDTIASVEGKASLAKYNEVLDSWFKEVHQVEKLVDEGNLQEARIHQREKTVGLRMQMEKILHDLIALNAARMESAGVQSEKDYKSSLFLLVGVSVVCLFFGFVLAFILLRKTNKVINQVIDSLKASAGQVGAASTQLAASSETQAQATTEQAASLEETAASLEEITAMIAKAADSANATATSSAESQAKAEEGRTSVEQMLNSMSEISEGNEAIMRQIETSNQQMTDIVKLIEEIGNKTKVINEIVFQTKLLSFNASVEAARAGEHGKGFAVVAEEVGNLAQMSGNAAKEISDMLISSISKVENIVTETKSKVEVLAAQGKQKVDSGVDVARQCSEILSEIVMNVTKVSALSQEISLASKEQAQGVSEINKAMGQLDAVTQSNASSSAESATAAEQLSSQSKVLNATVNELVIAIQGGVSADLSENTISNSRNLNFNGKKTETKKQLKLKVESANTLDNNSSKLKLVSGESYVPSHDDSGFSEN